VNGEASLQLWRIDANVLNNQYQTVDKGRSNRLGVGQIAHSEQDPVRKPINMVMGH
jgi:hypothetical protein